MLIASFTACEEAVAIASTNNAAPRDRLASITGILVTAETIGRALGPVSAATGFAWTLNQWGNDGHAFAFFCLALAHLVWGIMCVRLPSLVENEIKHPSDSAEGKRHNHGGPNAGPIIPDMLGRTEDEPDEKTKFANITARDTDDDKELAEHSMDKKQQTKQLQCHTETALLCKGAF
eukprot:gnl/MRDRNA2_/MRDRNA2_76799_c0_seq3.p1 gnl/MRDRNA2_/MRDRNA2_76799_c0~~gnl/MRDRNA2_/MRDRNA2_76799_c0_seq3.p1  ORF type:complete len:177 (+),score=33.11 gnl/MRDRNA2_/MRDRNA2_76799_c0_seq3:443-973(+)